MTKSQTIDLLRNQIPGFYSAEQVVNLIEKIEEEQVKPTKTKTKAKAKAKAKQDIDNKLTKAEMKEMADINNQVYTLLNRIDNIPHLKKYITTRIIKK